MNRVMMTAIGAALMSWSAASLAQTPAAPARVDDAQARQAQAAAAPPASARQPYRPRYESAFPQRTSRGGRDG